VTGADAAGCLAQALIHGPVAVVVAAVANLRPARVVGRLSIVAVGQGRIRTRGVRPGAVAVAVEILAAGGAQLGLEKAVRGRRQERRPREERRRRPRPRRPDVGRGGRERSGRVRGGHVTPTRSQWCAGVGRSRSDRIGERPGGGVAVGEDPCHPRPAGRAAHPELHAGRGRRPGPTQVRDRGRGRRVHLAHSPRRAAAVVAVDAQEPPAGEGRRNARTWNTADGVGEPDPRQVARQGHRLAEVKARGVRTTQGHAEAIGRGHDTGRGSAICEQRTGVLNIRIPVGRTNDDVGVPVAVVVAAASDGMTVTQAVLDSGDHTHG